ncbi:MAG: proline racemase [Asgard group archaeon]|nr:proline racemase [Asgard group archaeon]
MKISYDSLAELVNWQPPRNWLKISTIDAHSAGEPLRIILSGFPKLQGKSILDNRREAMEKYDHLRTAIMWEPRGHADMYGCIITPPISKDANFGVLFIHNEGFSTMCGHAILALTKVVLETSLIPKESPITTIKIDTPAGLVTSYANIADDKIESVYFHNVPSFAVLTNEEIEIPQLGTIKFDIAFGGAYYAFVQAEEIGISLAKENAKGLIEKGMIIKQAIMQKYPLQHPFESDLNFLYGTIFIGEPKSCEANSRNVCIFANGEVDRCPTGTGVSARMALHFEKGEISLNDQLIIESIIGSKYIGSIVELTKFGPYKAVIPRVEGTAHITGKNDFFIDPTDPLCNGFIIR